MLKCDRILVIISRQISIRTITSQFHDNTVIPECKVSYLLTCIRQIIVLVLFDIFFHYCDVIMGAMASQITSLTIVYSIVHSGADQRKHQSSASLAFVRGIPHKRPVARKIFLSYLVDFLCVSNEYRAVTFVWELAISIETMQNVLTIPVWKIFVANQVNIVNIIAAAATHLCFD